jgi:hypothetical protein
LSRYHERAGRPPLSCGQVSGHWSPQNSDSRFRQTIDRNERIVRARVEDEGPLIAFGDDGRYGCRDVNPLGRCRDRFVRLDDVDAHLVRQRPASDVIRRLRRTVRVQTQFRVDLRCEQIFHVRRKRLAAADHEGAGPVLLAGRPKGSGRALDLHAAQPQGVHQLERRAAVPLLGRD